MVQSGEQAMPFDTAIIDCFLCEYWHLTLKVENKYHSVLITAHRTRFNQPISNSIKWLTPAQQKLTAHTKFIIFISNRSRFAHKISKPFVLLGSASNPQLSMTLWRWVFIRYIFICLTRFVLINDLSALSLSNTNSEIC